VGIVMAKETITIDGDGFAEYSPYKSKCTDCAHFKLIDYNCIAFPDGIPAPFLNGSQIHDKVQPGQKGSTVFTSI